MSFSLIIALISGIIAIVLIMMQTRDGGLNVSLTSTLQAPVERRGAAKTLHNMTIASSVVFVVACIASFLG